MRVSSDDQNLDLQRVARLGCSLKRLIETVEKLEAMGVGFRSVTESIGTTTSGGNLVFHTFAALAEFERTLIRERTKTGLSAARARGRQGGRPKVLSDDKRKMAQALRDDASHSIQSICKTLGISRTAFYRYTQDNIGNGITWCIALPPSVFIVSLRCTSRIH